MLQEEKVSRRAALKVVTGFLIALAMFSSGIKAYASDIDLCNWFGSNFSFGTTLTGSVRYYDLNNIGCDFKAYTSSGTGVGDNNYFSVTLYRKNAIGSTSCGGRTALRNGSSHFDWTNVGAGNYYFYFSKAFDGQVVNCDAMGMYSW
ncbi:hypothetical protein [Paratractidigestivibacter faecalis]|uniref:Uncharacterized protein n=1 Tax=Paratractidigestivibacter faecalis TaxID=2292441 RepID=A0ABV1IFN3_9ACTN